MKKVRFLLLLIFIIDLQGTVQKKLTPLEAVSKYCTDSVIDHVFFTPEDGTLYKAIIRGLIQLAGPESAIRIAAFRFTDKDVCNDLIAAHGRGALIEAVFDPGAVTSAFYSAVLPLCQAGIPVYQYIPVGLIAPSLRLHHGSKAGYPTIMHQKSIIFQNIGGKKYVVFGSLNFTTAGFYGNEEAVQLRNKPEIVAAFLEHFELLKKRSYAVSLAKTVEQQSLIGFPYVILNVLRRFARK